MSQAAAMSRAQQSHDLLRHRQPEEAFALAHEAVAIQPTNLFAQTALGDAASELGKKPEAVNAWQAAMVAAKELEQDAQESYIPDLQKKIRLATQ